MSESSSSSSSREQLPLSNEEQAPSLTNSQVPLIQSIERTDAAVEPAVQKVMEINNSPDGCD